MKNYINILILFFVTIPFVSSSQDIIIKQNQDSIYCKVTEIKTFEILYKKQDNLNGPTYVLDKSNVSKILYESGLFDEFNENTPIKKSFSTSKEIEIRGNHFFLNNRRLGNKQLQSLLVSSRDQDVIESYMKSKKIQGNAYVIGFSSIPVYYTGVFFFIVEYYIIGGAITTIGLGMNITNSILLKKYKSERVSAVEKYNQTIQTEKDYEDDYF
jgi:hypothetical protein